MNDEKIEFEEIIKDIISNQTVQMMKSYRQHFNISCYEHCYRTAYYCYRICKYMHWDYKAVTRAAMLHDLFLYDWRVKNNRKGFHAFTHPKTAYINAKKLFKLNDKEKDIIIKHMWPVTLTLPKYKESYVLTLMDKFSAIKEGIDSIINCFKSNEKLKYAYVVIAFIMLTTYRRGKLILATILELLCL